jgi:hypothetical protein
MASREQPFSASSTTLSCLVVIGLLLMGILPLTSAPPGTGTIGTPLPDNSYQQPHEVSAVVSRDHWTEAEIVHGREECMHLLQSIAADAELLAPITGDNCGSPAPVRLKSFGSGPKVVFDPPVEINCRMMAALYRWNKTALQPAARNTVESPVVRIVGGSGYSCRNVYNLPDGKRSQHAFANAIDIAAFELKDGRSVTVLEGWGPTARDIKAQFKSKSESVSSNSPALAGKAYPTSKATSPSASHGLTRASLSLKTPPEQKPEASVAHSIRPEGGVGAPKPTMATKFLSRLHKGACREFETVLGPEANDAHRNHFHLDLNPLRSQAYCE